MNNSTNALERRAERSRSRLSGLVDDLQQQISPGQVVDQLIGFTKDNRSDVGRSISQQISRNPLPYLLIAAGIGWLMISDANNGLPAGRNGRTRRKAGSKRKRK